MVRMWGPAALLTLALLGQNVIADPESIYTITGELEDTVVYDTDNLSAHACSNDFDYGAVMQMSQAFASQGVDSQATLASTIMLYLPQPAPAAGVAAAGGEAHAQTIPPTLDLVGLINYLGPADPNDPTSTLLGMYGGITGVPPTPGNPAADLNFYLYIETDPTNQYVEGGAVIGDTYWRFETIDGQVVITAYPYEVGLCRLAEAGAAPEPGPDFKKSMTKEERQAYRQGIKEQKKLGRENAKLDRAQKREDAKAEKLEKKDGASGRRRLAAKPVPLMKELQGHSHAHDHAHDDGHSHDDHAVIMHRHLQAGRLLVFLDFAPPNGVYYPWNQGLPITITQCSSTVLTASVRAQIAAAVDEDFAPFNVEITTDRTYYNSQGGRKVAVNIVRAATGVFNSGTGVCGVAYLNSLDWATNTVWTSCECGINAIPQISSHEVGHIFALRHDGTTTQPYLFGLPAPGVLPPSRRWNAIMGGVGNTGLEQWSRGEYRNANNREDDIAIMTNRVGTRVSTPTKPAACTTTFAYRNLATVASTTTTTYPTAIITCASGSHSYPMRIRGRYAITVTPPTVLGDMKFQVSIATARLRSGQWVPASRFTVLGANDAYSSAPFTYTAPRALTLNNYIIRIQAIAERGNSNTYPFPAYGSRGGYTFAIRNGF